MGSLMVADYTAYYARFDEYLNDLRDAERERRILRPALRNFMRKGGSLKEKSNGFKRMKLCQSALEAIDRGGWERSYHQRLFHENFLRACTRVFWKTEPHGEFARSHQKILETNGWDNLTQEILVSTPRRFGKTISVSMFAAAMIFSAPGVEVSIYSTCKRISQKLLRNIAKFLDIIYRVLNVEPYKIERANMEEIVLFGPENATDMRIVNSYPSKVCLLPLQTYMRCRSCSSLFLVSVHACFASARRSMTWASVAWCSIDSAFLCIFFLLCFCRISATHNHTVTRLPPPRHNACSSGVCEQEGGITMTYRR